MLLTDARRPAAHRRRTARWSRSPSRTARRWDRALDRGGRRADHRRAGARAARPVPAAGGDRRGPRRGADAREDTDWPQILALYELLERVAPNPMVTLNRAVAVAMVDGPAGRARAARPRSTPTTAWPTTTASTPSAPTCWRWPATDAAARDELPRRPRAARRASPSSATSRPAPRGSTPARPTSVRVGRRAGRLAREAVALEASVGRGLVVLQLAAQRPDQRPGDKLTPRSRAARCRPRG